jgi:colicin import membrane protein
LEPQKDNKPGKGYTARLKGLAGTTLLHLVFFAILILVSFAAPKPPENEKGIMVNFGTDETGWGTIEPSPPASQQEEAAVLPSNPPQSEAAVPAESKTKTKEEALSTQNIDKEAPEVKKVDPNAERKRKEKIEADKIRRAELETERQKKAAADAEKKRLEAEQKRFSDIANRTKNALANSRNSGTNSTSEGEAGGTGNQGVPTGSVDSKIHGQGGGTGNSGISYSLDGRDFKTLPNPRYDYQGEGKVVVDVSVDRTGKVVEAIPGAKGSTTLDDYLLRTAKEAALKATFNPKPDAPVKQKGTITYNFVLK